MTLEDVLKDDERLRDLEEQIDCIEKAHSLLSAASAMASKTGYHLANALAEQLALEKIRRGRAARITWLIDNHRE